MVDVKNKKCVGTKSAPSYGVEGIITNKDELCSQHAREGVADVNNKRCGHQGCNVDPSNIRPGRL